MPAVQKAENAWLFKPESKKYAGESLDVGWRLVQRIETRAQFQVVLAADTLAKTEHFVLHGAPEDRLTIGFSAEKGKAALLPDTKPGIWLGAMVPKRWAKSAVTRNTIKRQIYSVSQEFEAHLPMAAHVVRMRKGFDRHQFISASSDALKKAVRSELKKLLATMTPRRIAGNK